MENLLYIAAIVAAIAFLILCVSLSDDIVLIKRYVAKRLRNNGRPISST